MFEVDKHRLGVLIKRHKKFSAGLIKKFLGKEVQPVPAFSVFKQTGEWACLASASFVCENCGASENLQLHHMISRWEKKFIDKLKYVMQRNYFANILLLCQGCHKKIHQGKVPCHSNKCISKTKLENLKKYYCKKEKEKEE